jgi:cytoskeletal protein RodZ
MDFKKVLVFVVLLIAVGFLGWRALQKVREFQPPAPSPSQASMQESTTETVRADVASTTGTR